MHELPHYRITWQRNSPGLDDGILKEQSAVAKAVLKRLRTDGPLSTAAFSEHGHAVDWWWAPTRASRAVMEALFVSGRIGIARREGNRRYYDLIERLVPAALLKLKEPEEVALTHRLLSRFRATGLTKAIGTQGEVMYSAGSGPERAQRTARLVEDGELLPIEIDGLKGTRYMIASEEPILEATADPAIADAGRQLPRAARSARLGPAPAPRPVGLRLPVGGLRPRGEAQVGLLRPADPVRRPVRGPHRAAARSQGEDAEHPRHLVPGRLRADGRRRASSPRCAMPSRRIGPSSAPIRSPGRARGPAREIAGALRRRCRGVARWRISTGTIAKRRHRP